MEQQPSREGEPEVLHPQAPAHGVWRQVLLGLLILICGIAIGGGSAAIHTREAARRQVVQSLRHPEWMPGRVVLGMRRELGLSPEQARQVEAIIARRLQLVRTIRAETQPRIEEQMDLMGEEVAAVLNPQQAQKWREQFERMRRWQQRGPRRDGDHGALSGRRHRPSASESPGADAP